MIRRERASKFHLERSSLLSDMARRAHWASMLIILIPLLVCVVGVLIYALSGNPKLVEIGRVMFFVGLLWTVDRVAGAVVELGPSTSHRY